MSALETTYGDPRGSHIRVIRMVLPEVSGGKFGAFYVGRYPGGSFSSRETGKDNTHRAAVADLWQKMHGEEEAMPPVKPMSTKNQKPIVRDDKKLVRNQEKPLKRSTVKPARSVTRITK